MNLKNDERAKQAFRDATRLRDLGKFDEALAVLKDLLADYPSSPAVLGTLGGILFAAKRFSEARDYFKEVLTLRPNAELASLGFFHCSWALGDHAGARTELVRFLSNNESDEYNTLLREMGWTFDRAERKLSDA